MSSSGVQPTIKGQVIRTSLGLQKNVAKDLEDDYKSSLIEEMKEGGGKLILGDVEFRLAEEFGFCYGVEKAVDFAYQTIKRFPGKKIYITNEIIHNPRVNLRLIEMGMEFLEGQYSRGKTIEDVTSEDVVLIPAFGSKAADMERLQRRGCILVDTTCGSVVHVWKRVEKYARDGFTSLIHGKFNHEETIATSSHVEKFHQGKYIIVRDKDQAQRICDYIEHGSDKDEILKEFDGAYSAGFDPDKDLNKIGSANQTTMLSSESLEIAGMVKASLAKKFSAEASEKHFRSFDTICSATQERQDAVLKLAETDVDLILVIGGYNSSNTSHLLEMASEFHPTFHIQDAGDVLSLSEIRHQPIGKKDRVVSEEWLPDRKAVIGLTAGASTPNRVIEDVMKRVGDLRKV